MAEFANMSNKEFDTLELKRAQMYLNRDWAPDKNVSQEAMDYIAEQLGSSKDVSKIQASISDTTVGKVIAEEGAIEEGGDEELLPSRQSAEEGEDAPVALDVADTSLGVAEKTLKSKQDKIADDISKGKDSKNIGDVIQKGRSARGVGKALKVGGSLAQTYQLASGLDELDSFDITDPEDIATTSGVTSAASHLAGKGLAYGAKLAEGTSKATSLASSATKAAKVGNIAGAVSGGIGLIGDIGNLENLGSKGANDLDVASGVSSLAASSLSFGSGVAALTSAGAATGAAAGAGTASSVAAGSAAFGPVGWAIAALTILSLGLSEL